MTDEQGRYAIHQDSRYSETYTPLRVHDHAVCAQEAMTGKKQSAMRNVVPRTEEEKIDHREQSLDDALEATFPASDPPSALAPHCSQK